MNCPSCNAEVGENNQCFSCGYDIMLYKKAKSMAAHLYNKALVQAQNREMTLAVKNLTMCIKIDKDNCDARNLLGLVYFEVGLIGDALKQWVISSSLKKNDNFALDYINTIQGDVRKCEKYNASIKMYNTALNYMKKNSEDMAIIQLKKAVEINNNFVEAYNMMIVCLLLDEKYEKAMSICERVLEIDIVNEKALLYLNEIKCHYKKPSKNDKKNDSLINKKNNTEKRHFIFNEICGFILGVACVIAFMYLFVIPTINKENEQQLKQLTESNTSLEKSLNSAIAENIEKSTQIEEVQAKLSETSNKLDAEAEEIEKGNQIQQALVKYLEGNLEESATILLSLSSVDFKYDTTKQAYDKLEDIVITQLAAQYYEAGSALYWENKFDEAIVLYEKSLKMSEKENISILALYYLGNIYRQTGNNAMARAYYSKLVENYSLSGYEAYAEFPTYLEWAKSYLSWLPQN